MEAAAQALRGAREREKRPLAALQQAGRSRRMATAFLVLALAAVVAAVWAFWAQKEANRQRASAESAARQAQSAVARSAVEDAVRSLDADRTDESLAHL